MANVARFRPAHRQDENEIDVEATQKFLDLLDPEATNFTFQTYDDAGQDGKLARVLHGTFAEHGAELSQLNRRGACVAVTLNETNGRGAKRENITRVRAVVADLDDAPLGPVLEFALKPHIVVESSPGRYHAYWLVDGMPVGDFEDAQRSVAKTFNGDPEIDKSTHRARLPGFFHNKREPFRVRVAKWEARGPFAADEINDAFPPVKERHRPSVSGGLVLPAGVPLDAAKAFVEARYFHDGLPMLHRYRGAYYDWRASHYRQRSDAAVRAALYDFLRGVRVLKDGKLEPFNPNSAKVSMVLDALASGTLLDDEREAPFWIREGDTAPNLLAVRNGLLDVVTEKLTPHSPLYFNVNALAFDYNPNAPTPERWVRFLKELWPDDKDARATLREMFGLFLTADTSFQKLFLLVGPKRSGKGTIGHVLTMLLGRENVAHPTMASLATQFGLWPLIDKRLAIVPDARLAEGGKAVEHLLSVSGEDSLTIDRKYASHWTGKLVARFLILTNELPRFADASGALASRFVLLTLRNSFYGREELDLKARLRVELPGILNWSLDGLNHLRERGHFLMPASSRDALRQLEDLASPVSAFVRERCVVEPAARVEKSVLWGAWKAWCEDAGIHRPGSVLIFARNMYAAYPQVRPTHSGGKKYFVGVDLRDG